MEEKVFVGYGYGRFKNDRGDMQEYCNVFMLETLPAVKATTTISAGRRR